MRTIRSRESGTSVSRYSPQNTLRTPRIWADSSCSRRRTAASPPRAPSDATNMKTACSFFAYLASMPAQPYSMSSGWAPIARMFTQAGSGERRVHAFPDSKIARASSPCINNKSRAEREVAGAVGRPAPGEVAPGRGRGVVHRHVFDRGAQARVHGHRQPLRSRARLDPVPVLPAVLRVLHRVEEDEPVRGGPLGDVAEPRQIVRLVDRDLHGRRLRITAPSRRSGWTGAGPARARPSDRTPARRRRPRGGAGAGASVPPRRRRRRRSGRASRARPAPSRRAPPPPPPPRAGFPRAP